MLISGALGKHFLDELNEHLEKSRDLEIMLVGGDTCVYKNYVKVFCIYENYVKMLCNLKTPIQMEKFSSC